MKHVFEVSTGFGLSAIVAILRRYSLGPVEDRVLLVVNTVANPDASLPVHESPEYAGLLREFGRVVDFNALISPAHPNGWSPGRDSHHAVLAAKQLTEACGIEKGEPHTLWVESIHGTSSRSIARVLSSAEVNIYSDGLMTYGPTRIDLEPTTGDRVRGVYHLDLIPGQTPYVLREFDPEYHAIPLQEFLDVVAETSEEHVVEDTAGPVSLVIGQYLADLGLLTDEEDSALLVHMIEVALAEAEGTVVVRPHPRASDRNVARIIDGFVEEGYDVRLAPVGGLAESLFRPMDVALVVSCFSTALFTARSMGVRTIAVGAATLLRRLRPYSNSNRVPIAASDLLNESVAMDTVEVRPAESRPELVDLVLGATSLSMQPGVLEDLMDEFEERVLAATPEERDIVRRYVPLKRLVRIAPALYRAPKETHANASRRAAIGRRVRAVPVVGPVWAAASRALRTQPQPRRAQV